MPDGGPTGHVYVAHSEYPQTGGFMRYGTAEFFAPANPGLIDPRCTISQQNGCTVRDCPGGDGGTQPAPDAGPRVGAGTVALNLPNGGISLTRQSDGTYFGFKLTALPWWTCGERADVVATGATNGVPAFTASLTTPNLFRVTQPISDGGYFPLTRGSDLPVTWTPTSGVMSVSISSGNYSLHSLSVQCELPGNRGSFTIPAALTQRLIPGDSRLIVGNHTETWVPAGAWNVQVTAVNYPDSVLLQVQ